MLPGDLLKAQQCGLSDGADCRTDPPALEVALVALDFQPCVAVSEMCSNADQRRWLTPYLASAAS